MDGEIEKIPINHKELPHYNRVTMTYPMSEGKSEGIVGVIQEQLDKFITEMGNVLGVERLTAYPDNAGHLEVTAIVYGPFLTAEGIVPYITVLLDDFDIRPKFGHPSYHISKQTVVGDKTNATLEL